MASGDPVVEVLGVLPVGANPATPDVRVGGSTPVEHFDVWDFDAATIEYLDFLCRLQGYGGGGLTWTLPVSASSATSAEARMGVAVRRLTSEDVDISHAYAFNDVDITANGTSGVITEGTVTHTDGADMDSWANNEMAVVRVRRNATHANDDMTGDAELWSLEGKET